MTEFSDRFTAEAWDIHKDEHGIACTYTDVIDTSTDSVTMVFSDRGSDDRTSRGVFRMETSDVASSTIKRNDTITDPNSVVWVITDVRDRGVQVPGITTVEVETPLARA